MFDYRCGVRLAGTTADTAVLKLLRREFPDVPLTEHRRRILAGEPVYASGHEPSQPAWPPFWNASARRGWRSC